MQSFPAPYSLQTVPLSTPGPAPDSQMSHQSPGLPASIHPQTPAALGTWYL